VERVTNLEQKTNSRTASEDIGLILKKYSEENWAELIINRPEKRNALSLQMWEAIPQLVAEVEKDDNLRLLVIRSEDEKAFSAGADIGEFGTTRNTVENARKYRDIINNALHKLHTMEKPLIAAVRGYASGGGCTLALAADIRVAAESARFSIGAARLGVVVSYHNFRRLVALLGTTTAKEMLLFARTYSAKEALAKGLVSYVSADEKLDDLVSELVDTVRTLSQFSLKGFKAMFSLMEKEARVDEELFDSYTAGYILSPHFQDRVKSFK
jgi:enoyl-CoA hydratase/carnithine racemase